MKKKLAVILVIMTIIIGSFINFYMTNLVLSDVSNMFYGIHDWFCVSSVPGLMLAVDFVTALIFIMRYYRYEKYRHFNAKLYSIFLVANSAIGIIGAIISSIYVYQGMFGPNPFPGYVFIMLMIHIFALAIGIILLVVIIPKMPKDEEKRNWKVRYIIYTGILWVLVFFAFDRFGAFLWMPTFVQTRTLGLTFPFYLSLLLPIGIVIHVVIYFFDGYGKRYNIPIVYLGILLAANAILNSAVFTIQAHYTIFTSAISAALAIERLITMRIDTFVQFGLVFIIGGYYLIYSIRTAIRVKEIK